jgi:hypothetical protein
MELKQLGLVDRVPRLAIINAAGADTLYQLYEKRGLRWNGGDIAPHCTAKTYYGNVPMWSMTTKVELLISWSSQPSTRGSTMRCADEETGRNSVNPWTMPMMMAWTTSSISPSVERRSGDREGRWPYSTIHASTVRS